MPITADASTLSSLADLGYESRSDLAWVSNQTNWDFCTLEKEHATFNLLDLMVLLCIPILAQKLPSNLPNMIYVMMLILTIKIVYICIFLPGPGGCIIINYDNMLSSFLRIGEYI